jgi:uncharacterized membrane protein
MCVCLSTHAKENCTTYIVNALFIYFVVSCVKQCQYITKQLTRINPLPPPKLRRQAMNSRRCHFLKCHMLCSIWFIQR